MRCPTLTELPPPPPGKIGWPNTKESRQLPNRRPDGSVWPKVTVVTPSFNQAQFIEETIRSVLLQGYPDLEYFILDAGSTDGSIEIIRKYEQWLACWVSEPDKGQSHAINKGWQRSNGPIIAWLNSDDYYLPDSIIYAAENFLKNDDCQVLVATGMIVDQFGKLLSHKPPGTFNALDMLRQCGATPSQPAVFMRRIIFESIGGLNEELNYVMDWEYWIRICLEIDANQIFRSQVPLAASRAHSDTKTNQGVVKICEEHRKIMEFIFNSHRYSHMRKYRIEALKNSYWKQAQLAHRAASHQLAWKSALKAWVLLPRFSEIMRMVRYTAWLLKPEA